MKPLNLLIVSLNPTERKLQSIENHIPSKAHTPDDLLSTLATEAAQEIPSYRGTTSSTMANVTSRSGSLIDSRDLNPTQPALSYSLGRVGAGSNAIAMAAAQAVSNTLQVKHNGLCQHYCIIHLFQN